MRATSGTTISAIPSTTTRVGRLRARARVRLRRARNVRKLRCPRRHEGLEVLRELAQRMDAARLSLRAPLPQRQHRARLADRGATPELLQTFVELDHGAQHLMLVQRPMQA